MAVSKNTRKNKSAQRKKEFTLKNKAHMQNNNRNIPKIATTDTLLDKMVDGREYESLLSHPSVNLDVASEIKRAILAIQHIRNKPLICYLSNIVNTKIDAPISIDNSDDLPFAEMISSIPGHIKDIDVLLVTPGGSGQQVAKFVDRLRPRFNNVTFILPNMAMSAGTIFVMSGNDIIMDSRAYIGPIDPQIPNKNGQYVPAQSILVLLDEIQKRGQELLESGKNPLWSDLQLLREIDAKDIGNAMNASQYSIELVEDYLFNYKFKKWDNHSRTKQPVTMLEKKTRAKKVAELLCSHSFWKSHGRGINRDDVWNKCEIKVTHAESIEGLERAIRQFWALLYWLFENGPVYKMFISENYAIFRNHIQIIQKN